MVPHLVMLMLLGAGAALGAPGEAPPVPSGPGTAVLAVGGLVALGLVAGGGRAALTSRAAGPVARKLACAISTVALAGVLALPFVARRTPAAPPAPVPEVALAEDEESAPEQPVEPAPTPEVRAVVRDLPSRPHAVTEITDDPLDAPGSLSLTAE